MRLKTILFTHIPPEWFTDYNLENNTNFDYAEVYQLLNTIFNIENFQSDLATSQTYQKIYKKLRQNAESFIEFAAQGATSDEVATTNNFLNKLEAEYSNEISDTEASQKAAVIVSNRQNNEGG